MQPLPDNLQINLSNFTCCYKDGQNRVIPCLRVKISGVPKLSDIATLMRNLREITDQIPEAYVAITDLCELEVNKFFRAFILFGMEKSYKTFLAVKNQAAISFVVLGKLQRGSRLITDSLEKINKGVASKDYNYRYFFLEDESSINELIIKYFPF